MEQLKLNTITYQEFVVLDEDNNPVTGLIKNDFTIKLYNPDEDEISGSVTINVNEIGNGLYKISFTPDKLGKWILIVYHSEYFPYGKGNDFDCIYVTVNELYRILGLFQENSRILDYVYDDYKNLISAKIRIYANATDCNNNQNHIVEYLMTSTFLDGKIITSNKVVKL